jgi:hypothetical protein
MDKLLDVMTFEQKVTSIVMFAITMLIIKSFPWLQRVVANHENHLPEPAIIVVDGPHSDVKCKFINSLRERFKNNLRAFMLVSFEDLSRMVSTDELALNVKVRSDELIISPKACRYISGIHRSWTALVSCGNNLIIDHHFHHHDLWTDFEASFSQSGYLKNILLVRPYDASPRLSSKDMEMCTDSPEAVAIRLSRLKLI